MNRRLLFLVPPLLVASMVMSCGDGGGDRPIEQDDLTDILLALDEMPAGWTHVPRTESEGEPAADICGVSLEDEVAKPRLTANDSFQRSGRGPFFIEFIGEFTEPEAQEIIATATRTLADCASWPADTETLQGFVWQVLPLSFPEVGDERIAVRLMTDAFPAYGQANLDLVLSRNGRFVIATLYLVVGSDVALETPLDEFTEAIHLAADNAR